MSVRSTLFRPNAARTIARTAAALFTVALITACATDQPAPTGLNASLNASNGVPFTEGLASPAWQESARNLVSQARYTRSRLPTFTQYLVSPSTWLCNGPRQRSAAPTLRPRSLPATELVPGDVSVSKRIGVQLRVRPS